MGKCALFIDAGYLELVRKHIYQRTPIDYNKLIEICAAEHELLKAFYYNCKPVIRKGSETADAEKLAEFEAFLRHLKSIPELEIRLGRLVYIGDRKDGRPIFRQQQVDILLACDFLSLVFTRQITHAILITGDGDFVPLVEIAKDAGIAIILWHAEARYLNPYKYLKKICNERRLFTPDVVANTTLQPHTGAAP